MQAKGLNNDGTPIKPPTPTPEETIANTPDANMKFVYNASGNKTQIGINDALPSGYSTTNPTLPPQPPTQPVVASAEDTTGTTFKQFADGSYGRFDVNGTYQAPASQQDFQNASDAQGVLTKLNQAVNGTYPLTATQQAQVDGIKSQFAELIKEQGVANANLTGGTTVAQNMYGMGNSVIGLGSIKGSIDDGIAKIADLNSKMTSAVAQMTEGFQTENYNMLKAAYDTYSSAAKDRQSEIDTAQAAMTAAAKGARDYNLNVAKFNQDIANTKFDQARNTANDAFDQNYKTADLNEKIKTDAFDQAYKMEDLALKKQANNIASMTSVAVPTTSTGAPDKNAQAAFLANLPGGAKGAMGTGVQGLANYTILPSAFSTKAGPGGGPSQQQQFITMAKQFDPNYDENLAGARAAYIKNLQAGTLSQGILSANKAIAHLNSFADAVGSLHNSGVSSTLNALGTAIEKPFSKNLQKNASTATTEASGLKDELAKFFKGTGATDVNSIDDWSKNLNINATPGELSGTVQGALTLLSGQLDALNQQYTSTMGEAPSGNILQPQTLQKLSTFKNEGYKIDIPGVLYTDPKAYIASDPSAATNLKTVISAYPQLSQADALQLAQSLNQ